MKIDFEAISQAAKAEIERREWVEANGWTEDQDPCFFCKRKITTGNYPVHTEGQYRGKHRCDPRDSGAPYGHEATHPRDISLWMPKAPDAEV